MIAPLRPNPPIPLLNWCDRHGYEPCDCPAYLVTMGCADLNMEAELEARDAE